MDRFITSLGMMQEQKLPPDAVTFMTDQAEAFLRSGLTDFDFWVRLSPDSKAAFITANERIWRERCSLIGTATQSPLAATYVRDEEDGHDAMAGMALDGLVASMAKKEAS